MIGFGSCNPTLQHSKSENRKEDQNESKTIIHIGISINCLFRTGSFHTFILLWAAAAAVNRFIAHRLAASTQLSYSDRTLIQRVVKAATVAAVILISLKAA
ncbi:MAG: hypothetical protein WBM78_03345, partial [Desulfobacterales bacterium]